MSNGEIPKEVPKSVDSSNKESNNLHNEVQREFAKGSVGKPSEAGMDAFKASDKLLSQQKESPVNAFSDAVKSLTGVDFSKSSAGDQQKITDAINITMPKAVESLKSLNGADKEKAGVELTKVMSDAIQGTSKRIDSLTQRHADVVASLPAAEKQAYEDQVKRLSRANV